MRRKIDNTAKAKDSLGQLYRRVQDQGRADRGGNSEHYAFVYLFRGCCYCIWSDDESGFLADHEYKTVYVTFTSENEDRSWTSSVVARSSERVVEIVRQARRNRSQVSA